MTPCSHLLPFARVLERVVGIEYVGGKEYAVCWNCRCGSTRAFLWQGAPGPLKAKARQVEIERAREAAGV